MQRELSEQIRAAVNRRIDQLIAEDHVDLRQLSLDEVKQLVWQVTREIGESGYRPLANAPA